MAASQVTEEKKEVLADYLKKRNDLVDQIRHSVCSQRTQLLTSSAQTH